MAKGQSELRSDICLRSLQSVSTQCASLMEQYITSIENQIATNDNDEQYELEVRLGKYDQKTKSFTSGVSEKDYVQLVQKMGLNQGWCGESETFTDDLYQQHIRRRWNKNMLDKRTATLVKKLMVEHVVIETTGPYDLDVSLTREIPISNDSVTETTFVEAVDKTRTVYIDKCYQYSLTQTSKQKYEVEIEMLHYAVDLGDTKKSMMQRAASLVWRGVYLGLASVSEPIKHVTMNCAK